ncbi:MAG: hypothetical protein ABUL60_21655, partial [Myxococcales bacterium]
MSKVVSPSARLMLLFWLVVSGLVVAAVVKGVRQHGRGSSTPTASPTRRAPPPPVPSVVASVP